MDLKRQGDQRRAYRMDGAVCACLPGAVLDRSRRHDRQADGEWKTLKFGEITDGKGGTVTLHLNSPPVSTRYVRIS
jgi:hypothetical protein